MSVIKATLRATQSANVYDMARFRSRGVLALLGLVLVSTGTLVWGRSGAAVPQPQTPILEVNTKQLGNSFSIGEVGLSMDANELGSGDLSADHAGLVRLMQLLGPSVLRIGGSSVDLSWWTSTNEPPPPWALNTVTPSDLSHLEGLLAATGWRVLLGVNIGHFEPARAVDEARYAKQIFGGRLLGIEIGNEPDEFGGHKDRLRVPTYNVTDYLAEAETYRQDLTTAVPGLPIYGPATARTRWLTEMGTAGGMFSTLTQHFYPSSACLGVSPDALIPPTAAELLSPTVRREENETLNTIRDESAIAARPIRISETGSAACTGNASASPVFASSLWSLDWALRAGSQGIEGINFHGHLGVCGPYNQSPICASTRDGAKAGHFAPQPEYYGLLAARKLEGGRFVPTDLIASRSLPNLTTWATLAPDGTIKIAIDNFSTTGSAQPLSLEMRGYSAFAQSLVGPSIDARTHITLGEEPVTSEGQWQPKRVRLIARAHTFRVSVPPASAVIITLRKNRSRAKLASKPQLPSLGDRRPQSPQ